MKCEYCNKNIDKTVATHSCRTKRNSEKFGNIDEKIATMVKEGYPLLTIVNNSETLFNHHVPYHYIQSICRRFNVSTPSLKDALNSPIVRDQYKKTVEERFGEGITNVSQADVVKQKKIAVNIERYGVENPFQRTEVKEKITMTMLEKYGVTNSIHIPTRKSNTGTFSKLHKKISDLLTRLEVEHENDVRGKFKKFNDTLGRTYGPMPDIYIPEKNTVIEIYGDRWHMNPNQFLPSDVVRFFIGEQTAEEKWKFDKIRIEHIQSFGVDVIILWETDIKKDLAGITSLLKEKLCNN